MFDDDFALFFDDDNDTINKDSLSLDQSWCQHEWLPIQLIFSTVWNCKKCNCKKELYDKEMGVK